MTDPTDSKRTDAGVFVKTLLAVLVSTILAASASDQGLEYPVDVAVDTQGNVFVADHQAHALLKLEGGSFKVLVKGEGRPRTPLFGIRHIAVAGNERLVASDPATMKLYSIETSGNVTPVPDDDRLVTPWGIAVEPSGAILVVDRVTQRLRRVGNDGAVVDVADVNAPRSILFDQQGRILVLTDRGLVRIGEGGATDPWVKDAPFEFPHDAVMHPNGNVYVTDGYARAIWQVTPQGQVSPLVQGEPLQSPQGLALDKEGNLLVADAHAKAVFRISLKGKIGVLAR